MSMSETTIGSMNFNVLGSILKVGNIIRLGKGAEIGVLYGDTSAHLLMEFPTLTLLSIDPYLPYIEEGHDRSAATLNEYEQVARDRLAQFGLRSQIIKLKSTEAALNVPEESLDFVFIDAIHTYESVCEDILTWYPKIRTGGMLSGHDYSWPGVAQAVKEFQNRAGLSGFFTPSSSDVWFFIKP